MSSAKLKNKTAYIANFLRLYPFLRIYILWTVENITFVFPVDAILITTIPRLHQQELGAERLVEMPYAVSYLQLKKSLESLYTRVVTLEYEGVAGSMEHDASTGTEDDRLRAAINNAERIASLTDTVPTITIRLEQVHACVCECVCVCVCVCSMRFPTRLSRVGRI